MSELTGRTYTREEIERILESEIETASKQFGNTSYWAKCAREAKEEKLQKYDNGEVIEVERERYRENSMDFETVYLSNGTVRDICYGFSD